MAREPAAVPEVRLRLYFPHYLVAGHPSLLEISLENRAGEEAREFSLEFSSSLLACPACLTIPRLGSGQTAREMLEIEPGRPGHGLLELRLSGRFGHRMTAAQGTRMLKINADPALAGGNLHIDIHDLQGNAGASGYAGFGARFGDVHIGDLLGGRQFINLNDLLNVRLPEQFEEVALRPSGACPSPGTPTPAAALPRRPRVRHLPPLFGGPRTGGYRLRLQPLDSSRRAVRADAPLPTLCLIAKNAIILGRDTGKSDIWAHFHPASRENIERTNRISRAHARLEDTPSGLRLCDLGTPNGTFLDGRKVPSSPGGVILREDRGMVELAGDYGLQVALVPPPVAGGLRIANLSSFAGPQGPGVSAPHREGCVVLNPARSGEILGPVRFLWLLTEAALGSDASCPVCPEWPGLSARQAIFHHCHGAFWVEPLGPGLRLNEHPLGDGQIAPLSTGATLAFHDLLCRVEVD